MRDIPWSVPLSAVTVCLAAASAADPGPGPASGPLRIHAANPRYFADAAGKPVLLVGSHTWNSLVASPADWVSPGSQDGYRDDPPAWDGQAKVSLLDTDHIWGVGGNLAWVRPTRAGRRATRVHRPVRGSRGSPAWLSPGQ